tara:strand:- start:366 stop:656 length:291 start_codon:yes stop_codon:yes gene_type:complete
MNRNERRKIARKTKKLLLQTPKQLLRNIDKFDISVEERDYLLSTQASMQMRYGSPTLMWSVEQIKEKLDYYKMMKDMNMTLDSVVDGQSIFVRNAS